MFRQYYSQESADVLLENPRILSVITFDTPCQAPTKPGIIHSGLQSLSGHTTEVIECSEGEIARGISGDSKSGECHWSENGEILCAAHWLTTQECEDIESSTQRAYTNLLNLLNDKGYLHPFRFWNFIPRINHGEEDLEQYKQFCTGRLNAFEACNLSPASFPAASALGHHSPGAVIYVLASRKPAVHHENPRQESAYEYPRQYGPSSPSFARASSLHIGQQHLAFISGTASILGHETKAIGDIVHQTELTLENIHHLATHINQNTPKLNAIRVYLRREEDLEMARNIISSQLADHDVTYTLADICRANLLIEVEAAFERDGSE